jgi:hypothetical protein
VRSLVGELDGVTTFCEMAVPLASRLAEKLGLPCNTPEAVDNARDKVGPDVLRLRTGRCGRKVPRATCRVSVQFGMAAAFVARSMAGAACLALWAACGHG